MTFPSATLSNEKQQALLDQEYDPKNIDDASAIVWMLISYFSKASLTEYKDLDKATKKTYLNEFQRIRDLLTSAKESNIEAQRDLYNSKNRGTTKWQKDSKNLEDFYTELIGGQKLYEYLMTCKEWQEWWLESAEDKTAHLLLIKEDKPKSDSKVHEYSQNEMELLEKVLQKYSNQQVTLLLGTLLNVARVDALANHLVYISAVTNIPKLNTLAKRWYQDINQAAVVSSLTENYAVGEDLIDLGYKLMAKKGTGLKMASQSSQHVFRLMSLNDAKELRPFTLLEVFKDNNLQSWGLLPFLQKKSGLKVPGVIS